MGLKTIQIDYDAYQRELAQARKDGTLAGRLAMRAELAPVIDEIMFITRIEKRPGEPDRFIPEMKDVGDKYRWHLRRLTEMARLIKQA